MPSTRQAGAALVAASTVLTVSGLAAVGPAEAAQPPQACFSWAPDEPRAGQRIQLASCSSGAVFEHRWDVGSDSQIDSWQPTLAIAADTPGPLRVTLEVQGAAGSDRVEHVISVVPADSDPLPWVSDLQLRWTGTYLDPPSGTSLEETLTFGVDWGAAPSGFASVHLNGSIFSVLGETPTGFATALPFNLLPTQDGPSTLVATPFAHTGSEGHPSQLSVWKLPHTTWLNDTIKVNRANYTAQSTADRILYSIFAAVPDPPWSAVLTVDSDQPLLNGAVGIESLQAALDMEIGSDGDGAMTVATEELVLAGSADWSTASLHGAGAIHLQPTTGLRLDPVVVLADGESISSRNVSLMTAVPPLGTLVSQPVVNEPLERFTHLATASALHRTTLAVTLTLEPFGGDGYIAPNPFTTTIPNTIAGTVRDRAASDHLAMTIHTAGASQLEAGWPPPTVRGFSAGVSVQASVAFDHLFRLEPTVTSTTSCTAPAGASAASCTTIHTAPPATGQLSPIPPFPGGRDQITDTDSGALISGAFAGAGPVVTVGPAGPLLVWTRRDPDAPVLESLDLLWSTDYGGGWNPPQPVRNDPHLDLHPVVSTDSVGRYVAAWLRAPAPFTTPVDTVADLPLLLGSLEVVASILDPTVGSWSEPEPLTDDSAVDTTLRIARTPSGTVVLAWLSTPDGALVGTVGSPASVRTCEWNGGGWSSPLTVADGIVGATDMAVAARGDDRWIVLAVDPDGGVVGDERLDWIRSIGGVWEPLSGLLVVQGHEGPNTIALATGATGPVWIICSFLERVGAMDLANIPAGVTTVQRLNPGADAYQLTATADSSGHTVVTWVERGSVRMAVYEPSTRLWNGTVEIGGSDVHQLATTAANGTFWWSGVEAPADGSSRTAPSLAFATATELRPDLTVSAIEVRPTQPPMALVEVRNVGPATAPAGVFIELWRDAVNTGELTSWLVTPDPLPPSTGIAYLSTIDGGSHRWIAVVDPDNTVDESDETNNLREVNASPTPPDVVAQIHPLTGLAPLTVALDGTGSSDPDGGPVELRWLVAGRTTPLTGPAAQHTFSEPGQYRVTLVVTDSEDRTSSASVTVTAIPADGDVDSSGAPDANDLLAILHHLYVRPHPFADINGSGAVNAADLGSVLGLITAAGSGP